MKLARALFTAVVISSISVARVVAEDAVLHGKVFEGASGLLTPCTVVITDANGKLVSESESFRNGFRCVGEFTKSLPAGRTRIRITRGFEIKAIEQDLNLLAGQTNTLTFTLERVVDLRKRGWYGGDSHVHMLHGEKTVPVDFDFVALTAKAEDLQYMSLAQAWNIDAPSPERLEAELRKRSKPDCVLTWNLEAPKNYYKGDAGRCLGHCWNAGMRGRTREGADVIQMLIDASAWDYESTKPSYANFESHQLIHEQGGAVCYTHPARWWMGPWGGQGGYPKQERMRVSNMAVELPLDTLLGPTYDGLDVITGSGEAEANANAFKIWSLLLNHGYRLAATGSSDSCFDRPGGGVPGTPRTYSFVQGKFAVSKAANAIAAGATFVTTGPLLIATIDGKPPGTVLSTGASAHRLAIEAWASGRDPGGLQSLEILRNGELWREVKLQGRPGCLQTNVNIVENDPAWYCVRVSGSERQTAISSAFYFAGRGSRPPAAAQAQIHAKIVDADTGQRLDAAFLTEVTFAGTVARSGKRHRLNTGEGIVRIPGTARLRAEAKGYEPGTLSPFLDNPELVKLVTTLDDHDLWQWQTYETIQHRLQDVQLVFRLKRIR